MEEESEKIKIQRDNAERPDSPGSSCVSLKSEQSTGEPPNFKDGSVHPDSENAERPDSPGFSCVSFKSEQSMGETPNFKDGSVPQDSENAEKPNSPGSSCVSFKSEQSMGESPNFKDGSVPHDRKSRKIPGSCVPRQKLLKQNQRPNSVAQQRQKSVSVSSGETQTEKRNTGKTTGSSVSRKKSLQQNQRYSSVALQRISSKTPGSSVSSQKPLKQNQSRNSVAQQRQNSVSVSSGETQTEERKTAGTGGKLQKKIKDHLKHILHELEKRIHGFIKQELEIYRTHLMKSNIKNNDVEKDTWNLKQGVLNMTQYFLKKMNHEDLAEALQKELIGIQEHALKCKLSEKCRHVCEGIAQQGESTILNKIYTDMYITEGAAGQVNKDHEVRLIQKNNVKADAGQLQQDVQIECKNMFELLPEQERPIRTVLTQGVAGIGKSICVQKFILDWAEEKEYKDIQFIFPLPFRELNLKKGRQSLMDIICFFFPETEGLRLTDQHNIMFILDGLDECQLPLAFQKNNNMNNVSEAAPLDVVLTNLIKGNLLPSAQIWITTRPAAASKIPAECVDRMTELRGFNDQQKEQYFRKRITDQVMANKLIDHIRESRSLHIMCHIPVFCWISATVLQKILEETESEETPKTLTEMYTCFLIFQAVQGNMKYTRKNAFDIPWDKEAILALGKLSFQHLEESNLIFYIEDLEECGIDPSKILICSGLCTQETVRFLGTVFSFVHLSIQEFLAAVFAYLSLKNDNRNVFEPQSTSQESKTTELIDFLKTAVDKALESDHGHLDLFLRFLLGLSLESNEKLIRGLLTVGLLTGSSSDCRKEIVEYIKIKFKENPSPERSINLFYCLNELNDDSLVKEIQSYMSSGRLSEAKLSPAQWSALVFVLLTSKEKLDEFDLKKFIRSEECLNRLLPVVKEATTALLNECNLTERSCSALLEVLKSESSTLTLLDMSKNSIQDSGMELLCEGLKSSKCKVETLILSECNLTERSCSALFKVLSSESSRLTLLDLSNNAIQDSGVELLSEGLKSPQCKLEKLRLSQCNLTERSCSAVLKVLSSESSTLTLLDLSNNPIQDSGVEMLCEGLNSLNCKLETLRIINDDLTDKSCSDLARVLTSSTLRELDLSNNNLQDSGVNKLTSALKNPSCKLKTLSLSFCSVKEKGYADLASGLRKNASSCLIELDLRGNDPGDTGVKNLSDPNCKLNTLRLLKSEAAEEAYNCLKNILNEDPLTQRTLDLSKTAPKDINVKNLSALLEDPHCRVEKLRMYEASSVTFDNCADVISALNISPSHLRELDLNGNILGQLGLQKLCELLENPHCKLEILRLKNSITKEGCGALMSALCSNPSHLIELDLSGNKFGNPGVEHISCLLKDSDGKVKRLNLSNCDITEGGYDALASALKSNPSSRLMELDLRGNDPGDTGVRLLTELIEDQNCNLKTLRLLNSDSGEKACNTLTKALKKDSFLQRELDLSRKIQKSSPWRDEKGQTGYQHQNIPKDLSNVLSDLENKMTVFMKHELEMYKKCLKKENTPYYRKVKQIRWNLKQTVLNMTLDFLKLTNNEDVAAALQNELIGIIQRPLKEGMKNKYHHVCEGITKQAESTSMNKIYTDLYITEGGSGHVNHEHEVRRIEKNQMQQEVQIECRNMFELLPGQDRPIRTVLTQGVAGVGKSFCVQKYILDWAEGEEHQDIQFIFPLPFRELNLKKGHQSLMDIISFFFPETKGLILTDQNKVMFIFDGLDECKLPLSFHKNKSLKNVCEAAPLDVVITNLIKGNLLPSAQIWITTRPAAASMIPAECVDRVSEVRGFNDQQKEEYFRKRISDQVMANKIIDHIRESRSLHIMCHIPVFCWISATVLQKILEETENEETPKTLTEMYTWFLIFQTVQGNVKYMGKNVLDIPWDKEAILALGKLAFQQLEENNLIFYAAHLEACGIDPSKISVCSGLCTQETGRFLGTVFSFAHLSIREFIAALFAYIFFRNDNRNVFESQSTSQESKTTELIDFLKTAVDKALESEHGHLDLFLRFLLGLSLESNEKLIRGLLNQTGSGSDCRKEIIEYIKIKFKENPSPERSINLFYCLNELNDDSLVKEIQSYMSSGCLSEAELSPAQWSALVFVLLTSKEKLDEFDLKKFIRSDECLNRLLPVVQEAKSALLSECNLTERSCSSLLRVLSSESSTLTLLDLSNNPIQNSGVELLSEGLKSPNCKLETLRIADCRITEEGYAALASALKSNPSSTLMELDLRGNDPGDEGVRLLTDLTKNENSKLKTLRLSKSDAAEEAYATFTEDLGTNSLRLRERDLKGKIRGDSGVKQLSDLRRDSQCSTKIELRYVRGQMKSTATSDQLRNVSKDFPNILNDIENKMIVFMKHELEIYKKLLRKENTAYHRKVKQIKWNLKQTVLKMTLDFLNLMNREDIASALRNELIGIIQRPLKEGIKNKYHRVCEGITKQGETTSLKSIYTDLYITEGGSGHVNKEHEVRRIEKNQMQQEVQIECKNMFELLPGQDGRIRTVLTQGVAGVGKSICVQKFILDWAEGEEHQDIQFIFPLPFRELNLKKGRHSLMDIISFFFPETQGLILTDQYKVMFIFDGLDDCKLPLSFYKNESLENVCEAASLDVVLTNLIKGNLLPSAQIWITTRPVAASMIPAECVDRVSEVRGFNDQQKEEYFRKRISDQDLANKIIDHIRESRSLFIMCHIPVFCWISATVLQEILEETESEETPKTLTNMYTCFLIFQAVQGNVKYNGKDDFDIPWDKEAILGLGKLSFQHLEENNLIFYIEDLEECGVDTSKISVYSGLCTQETVRFLGTVFSFVHLSIQEFIAALFAYLSLRNDNRNVFEPQSTSQESKTTELIDFLKTAVDKALESDHGHLDLFLRFLLGLSLESNEKLIRGLLTQTGSSSDCQKEIVEYIKSKFKENPSPERSINLFYCLNELNDDSLVKEIQSYMSSGRLSEVELSPAQWSALVFVLLTSKEKLDVFDLKKFIRSDECLNRLLPVVQEATSALLSDCNLTEKSCSVLLKVLNSESSTLTLLDLSYNPIKDFGVELLSEGLKSSNCKLETLNLSSCSITGNGYISLASALNPSSPLKELDLRGNDPGDTGVKIMTDFLQDTTYKLKLRLLSDAAERAYATLTEKLGTNPLLLREMDLKWKIQGDSGLKQLSDLLKDSHCRIKILGLSNSNITEEGSSALSSAISSNPSHLTELDLSENKLGNSGVKQICGILENPDCGLKKLDLSFCNISEQGYTHLESAVKLNTSLKELVLRGNDPGETGVKILNEILEDSQHNLSKLRLLKSSAVEEFCASLTNVLGTNPLLLRELDLSGKIRGDSAVKQLSDLLEDLHCRTTKLKLKNSNFTEEGCAALSAALCSNPSHLIELDLSENVVGNSGVKHLCDLLNNQYRKLQRLKLSFCSVTEEGYAFLASALKNPALPLIELDLRGNDPGETGVKKIIDSSCYIRSIRLLNSSDAEEICKSKDLGENLLLLRELNLRGKIQGDSGMKQLSALLKDLHCRIKKLKLNNNNIAEDGCAALSSALYSNPSHLIDLDLSENKLGNSGVKQLCSFLNKTDCKLQQLKLSFCSITEEGYAALASAIKSNPSSLLNEMDLRGNDPGETGVELLTNLQNDAASKLKKIRLLKSSAAEEAFASLTEVLGTNPLLLRELDLSEKIRGDSAVKQLSDLLEDSHCRPKKLKLKNNNISEEGCTALSAALCSNPSHLIDLNLSENKLLTAGVKQFSAVLKNPQCQLQKLNLSDCGVTGEGYAALASALKSNCSSHLIELDLRGNDPGETGVNELYNLLVDPQHKLSTLRLLKSSAAENFCAFLTEALGTSPLLLRELDLSEKIRGDSAVKQLSALLKDSHCRTKILRLSCCSITEEGYVALASALKSNPFSLLTELDLRGNDPGETGVQLLTDLQNDPRSNLKRIFFFD